MLLHKPKNTFTHTRTPPPNPAHTCCKYSPLPFWQVAHCCAPLGRGGKKEREGGKEEKKSTKANKPEWELLPACPHSPPNNRNGSVIRFFSNFPHCGATRFFSFFYFLNFGIYIVVGVCFLLFCFLLFIKQLNQCEHIEMNTKAIQILHLIYSNRPDLIFLKCIFIHWTIWTAKKHIHWQMIKVVNLSFCLHSSSKH